MKHFLNDTQLISGNKGFLKLTTQGLTQFSPPLRGISASKVSLRSLSAGIGNYLLSKASSVSLFFIDVFTE